MEKLSIDAEKLEVLITEAKASGGSERSNYQLFVERLCVVLALPRPAMAREENRLNDYVFERTVSFKHPDGSTTSGFIDCYRRDSFVLEAKQSRKRHNVRVAQDQLSLLSEDTRQFKAGHALRGTRGWDQVMIAARKQADNYARALPVEHGYPPFLLVVDVGHVIEVYADFSGQGKNYAQFPDRQSYRISMDDLRDPVVQARLRSIWINPQSLDPTRIAAQVTRDIADRLARIAKRLEAKNDAKQVAEFLMRCLFTMFAEDVELIPKDSFRDLLGKMRDTPQYFVPALENLWSVMDGGGYAPHLNATLKKFNGGLFKTRTALPLEREDIVELWIAAGKDWSDVEPAIFGTLLERALDSRERAKLGAHYTPRAYVERLIVPTIIEPLRADWDLVQGQIKEMSEQGKEKAALAAALRFHRRLCTTRVLDPACGTGNFLYVALELIKKLEGEVLEAIAALGGRPDRYSDYPDEAGRDLRGQRLARTGGRFTVDPHQFHGLEINPRAVPIADLVLWIGYLKWQLKTFGINEINEPVLDAYGTIRQQDAVIAYDRQEMVCDAGGRPLSRWDGVTKKLHPVTGEPVPDPDAQVPLYRYVNPRRAAWPEAEFIVGNPPFVGGKDMRAELGDGYAEACWAARPDIPGGADFVTHFWDEAATRLLAKPPKGSTNPLRRFGFITTNSITQTFSRRVIERHVAAKEPLSLVYAIPDHPWLKAADKAAVRVAMTVVEGGQTNGVLAEVAGETAVNTDTPQVELKNSEGIIRADLTIGADLIKMHSLFSNTAIGTRGVQLMGQGFLVESRFAQSLRDQGAAAYVRPYVVGRDLVQRHTERFVLDFYGLKSTEVAERWPSAHQHLLIHVLPERLTNNRPAYRQNWWIFGENSTAMRKSVEHLPRYIATCRTAAHRIFMFLEKETLCESKAVVIATADPAVLAILSSRVHVAFAERTGGWLGVGNDPTYNHSECFNPFPFPLAVDPALAFGSPRFSQRERLQDLGERLDDFRKKRLAEHPFLTMTGLYNALERLREVEHEFGPPLSEVERDVHRAGLVSVLKELHDDIDRAVLAAYGWDDLAPMLAGRPGGTRPSPNRTIEQARAEDELLSRLANLNRERAAEERRGLVRWLRPDYQIPWLGAKAPKPDAEHVGTFDITLPEVADRPKWPTDGLEQIRLVRDLLAKAPAPTPAGSIASVFDGKATARRQQRVAEVLETLVATGLARTGDQDGQRKYFLPR
ncbi:hypothetical protein MFUR16E_18630 [Methylobacterium fujisawaense]